MNTPVSDPTSDSSHRSGGQTSKLSKEWRIVAAGWRTARGAGRDDFGMVASSIAFSSFLSLLPLLTLVILAYGTFTEPKDVVADLRNLIRIIPAEARGFIDIWLSEALLERRGREAGLILSLSFLAYSASRAGRSLLFGLNVAYRVEGRRGFVTQRITSILMVLVAALLVSAVLFAISAFAFAVSFLPEGLFSSSVSRLSLWPGAAVAAVAALSTVYKLGPAKPAPPWKEILPGAIVATLLWLAATMVFSFYLSRFDSFGRIYGSLGAIVLLQFWLLASAFIFLLGARFNVEYSRSESQAAKHA